MKYRKKSLVIEAQQWHGWNHFKNCEKYHPIIRPLPILTFIRIELSLRKIPAHKLGWVGTLKDGHIISPGDYLIKDVLGEYYPCKPDIFKATYEKCKELINE